MLARLELSLFLAVSSLHAQVTRQMTVFLKVFQAMTAMGEKVPFSRKYDNKVTLSLFSS